MTHGSILIADDEELIRRVLADALGEEGYSIESVDSGARAWMRLKDRSFDLALFDIHMPDLSGLDLLLRAQEAQLPTPIVIMTGQTTMANAVEAMKRGAFDYLTKPFDLEEVKALAARAVETQRLSTDSPSVITVHGQKEQIIGRSPAMQELYKTIGRVVKSDATILIQGESGTGKELIARVIHQYSSRWRALFLGVNCSAIPSELLESEFFGHERGAFPGAIERRIGKFEQAAGGTLFLDEIGDMPLALQAKLLRVLQEREFSRVGGRDLIKADVRIIAATNQDLATAVKEQRFREDLYFRLRVIPLTLPPLRQRREDIPELVSHFIQKVNQELETSVAGVTPEAMALLTQYSWPGNVRELENTILRAAVLAPGRMLTATDLSLPEEEPVLPENFPDLSFEEVVRRRLRTYFQRTSALETSDLYEIVINQVEKPLIELTLEYTSGNQLKAAELLGINRNTLRKKITDLKIDVKKGAGN